MGAKDKVEARGLLLSSMRRRAGLAISSAVARLLIDKTAKLLELADPGMAARKRRRDHHDAQQELLRQERVSLGGHLCCDGGRQRGGRLGRM